MISFLILLCFLMHPDTLFAQEHKPWEEHWERFVEMEDINEADMDALYDMLCELEAQPLDANKATREDWEQLTFLTAKQIEDICEHTYRHRGMRSIGELIMIESLDYNRRKLLEHFVCAGKAEENDDFPTLKDIAKYGRHKLTAMGKIPFYERKGDKNGYLGYQYKHWLRYDFTLSNRLRAGFVASQDAGEPFFSAGNNAGYDYYSAYLQIKKLGCLDNLILGRYRVSTGMGLVINSGLSFGKQMTLANLGRSANTLRVHSSRSEEGYFQGAAATIRLHPHFTVDAFASYRPYDATLNKDDGSIATLLYDGYHRTPTEMGKKHNSHAAAYGANILWRKESFHLGATAVYTLFDRELHPKTTQTYRRYYPAGNDFVNIGVNYGFRFDVFNINGETAINRDGYIATIHTLAINITDDIDALLLHRYYSHRYTSLYARSFADGSKVNNEHGIYGGINWRVSRKWNLSAYSDFAYFYWPKYLISQSSWSSDNMLSATFRPSESFSIDARYRLRIRQRNASDKHYLTNKTDHRARIGASYSLFSNFYGKSQLDLSLSDYKSTDRGAMLGQTVGYANKWFKVSTTIKYFRTDSYDSRLYSYEPGLPYSFYFPAYYGHGIRYSLIARADINSSLQFIAKLGTTKYFDRNTISSGLQAINSSSMTDLEMQVRWKI